jgi:protein disulfide-isomerase A6
MMMWYSTALVTSTASLLFSLPVEASIYSKDSPVLQVTSRTYDRLIAKSNHTSVSSRLCITMIK